MKRVDKGILIVVSSTTRIKTFPSLLPSNWMKMECYPSVENRLHSIHDPIEVHTYYLSTFILFLTKKRITIDDGT